MKRAVISKAEKSGLLAIISVMGVYILMASLFNSRQHNQDVSFEDFVERGVEDSAYNEEITLQKEEIKSSPDYNNKDLANVRLHKDKYFNFDPNELSLRQAKELKLPERVYRNMRAYLNKGGTFYSKEQLLKIYGMTPDLFKKIQPFVQFKKEPVTVPFSSHNPATIPSDINKLSAMDLRKYHRLDFSLAYRIIRYRDKLGGFYSVQQLKEVYNLPDSTFIQLKDKLTVKDSIHKILINKASLEMLSNHPYIRKKRAELICAYKSNHGRISSEEDLKLIYSGNVAELSKLLPYLEYN